MHAQGIASDLGGLVRVSKLPSAVYSGLTVAFLGGGLMYLAFHADTLVHVFSMPTCPLVTIGDWVFLWRCIGASLLVLPTWTYSLKVGRLVWMRRASALGHAKPCHMRACMTTPAYNWIIAALCVSLQCGMIWVSNLHMERYDASGPGSAPARGICCGPRLRLVPADSLQQPVPHWLFRRYQCSKKPSGRKFSGRRCMASEAYVTWASS